MTSSDISAKGERARLEVMATVVAALMTSSAFPPGVESRPEAY
jgi:hypothetical protein